MASTYRSTVKRLQDQGLSRVKKALDNKENPLSRWEIEFIRTSCHILDVNSEQMMKRIIKRAIEKGDRQAKRVMLSIRAQLDDLGTKAENFKRPTTIPAFATRTYDDMDAPARSLAHLQACARGLKNATEGGYSRGIKVAKIAMENAIGDFKATVARVKEACKWKQGTAKDWYAKGVDFCGDLMEEATQALQEAEAREAAEAKVRIMEDQCEELVNLAEQAGKQIVTEAEAEQLTELEEEMEQRKDTVEGLGWSLKETIPAEFKERAHQPVQDSIKIVEEGKRHLGHVRARLEFLSADSESGSYKGPAGAEAGAWRQAPGEPRGRGRMGEDNMAASNDLVTVLRGWRQLKANDSGWPAFDGRYASYPRFKREWMAYRETYHFVVNDDLAAKTLREKCVKGDALRMVSHLDDLREIWDTLDTCFERPEKYMEEAIRPIVEFRKYKAADSSAVREFYSVLRVAIKGARSIGRLSLLINDQTVPRIMSKMPYAHWKEWATKR
jgi:hypothetical protein